MTRNIIIVMVVSLALCGNAQAQPVITDLGLMGGSNVVFLPTTATMPDAEFRFDISRFSPLRTQGRSLTGLNLTGGLTDGFEFTLRFHSGETGGEMEQDLFGFGGKVLSPINLPGMTRTAFLIEETSTFLHDSSVFYTTNVVHTAAVLQPRILLPVNGHVIAGISRNGSTGAFLGINAGRSLSATIRLGAEIAYNYFGLEDATGAVVMAWRVHPAVGVQVSPGFLHAAGRTSMALSLGFTVSTTTIEFLREAKPKTEENVVPSFDDLLKQVNEEQTDTTNEEKKDE